MTLRFIKPDEYERAQQIVTYCFPWLHEASEESISYKIQHIKTENVLGYYDENDNLMALVENIPFKIMIDGNPMDMGGIAMVSSLPEIRHGGNVATLLKRWLEIMKERGQTLSMLGPFSYEFYRKYGWELGFERMNYTIPIEYLNTFSHKTGNVRPITEEDIDKLDDIYISYAKKHNGCAVRDKTLWTDSVLNDPSMGKYKRYAYLWFYDDGTNGGYIIYNIRDNKMNVYEMMYKDLEAEKGLLNFMYSHQSQISHVKWSTAPDEMLHLILPNPRIEMNLSPGMMCRVVDVENALTKRRYYDVPDIDLKIQITDPIASWNNNGWEIHISKGYAHLNKCSEPTMQCDVQTFSQIFFGYITPTKAVKIGKLKGEEKEISLMDKIFSPSVTFNNNPF